MARVPASGMSHSQQPASGRPSTTRALSHQVNRAIAVSQIPFKNFISPLSQKPSVPSTPEVRGDAPFQLEIPPHSFPRLVSLPRTNAQSERPEPLRRRGRLSGSVFLCVEARGSVLRQDCPFQLRRVVSTASTLTPVHFGRPEMEHLHLKFIKPTFQPLTMKRDRCFPPAPFHRQNVPISYANSDWRSLRAESTPPRSFTK